MVWECIGFGLENTVVLVKLKRKVLCLGLNYNCVGYSFYFAVMFPILHKTMVSLPKRNPVCSVLNITMFVIQYFYHAFTLCSVSILMTFMNSQTFSLLRLCDFHQTEWTGLDGEAIFSVTM